MLLLVTSVNAQLLTHSSYLRAPQILLAPSCSSSTGRSALDWQGLSLDGRRLLRMLTGKSTSARGIRHYNDGTETAQYKCMETVKGLGKGISTMRHFIIFCTYTKMGIFGWSSQHKSFSCCKKKSWIFFSTDFISNHA